MSFFALAAQKRGVLLRNIIFGLVLLLGVAIEGRSQTPPRPDPAQDPGTKKAPKKKAPGTPNTGGVVPAPDPHDRMPKVHPKDNDPMPTVPPQSPDHPGSVPKPRRKAPPPGHNPVKPPVAPKPTTSQ
jgi:hypothetical protein